MTERSPTPILPSSAPRGPIPPGPCREAAEGAVGRSIRRIGAALALCLLATTSGAQEPPAPLSPPIPRAALVDVARAQSGVICASEPFLACMGFDADECVALSEAAIERCLLVLPEEIDPSTLDSAALEDCPRALYEEAGHEESRALACFEEAMETEMAPDAGGTGGGGGAGGDGNDEER